MKHKSEHTPNDLLELEAELAKLRPSPLPKTPLSREPERLRYSSASFARQLLTLSLGMLIGAVLGGAATYSLLQQPQTEVQAIDIPEEIPELEIAQHETPSPVQISTTCSHHAPMDFEKMIESYMRRSELLAKHQPQYAAPTYGPRFSEEINSPDSLLRLRETMEL